MKSEDSGGTQHKSCITVSGYVANKTHAMKVEMFKVSTVCTPGPAHAAQPNKTALSSFRDSLSYFKMLYISSAFNTQTFP